MEEEKDTRKKFRVLFNGKYTVCVCAQDYLSIHPSISIWRQIDIQVTVTFRLLFLSFLC